MKTPFVLDVSVEGGKYRIVQLANGKLHVYRHGEFWLDATGHKLILAMAQELEARSESSAKTP